MLESLYWVQSQDMTGVYKLEIQESEDDLKQLLRQQKTASDKERIQLLYLLKSGQANGAGCSSYPGSKSSHATGVVETLPRRRKKPVLVVPNSKQHHLLYQPPHCPKLNPIEQVWQYQRAKTTLSAYLQHLSSCVNS